MSITPSPAAPTATSQPSAPHGMLSPRVEALRKQALDAANEPNPCERGWAVMRSYDETRALPMPIRRAKAIAAFVESRTLTLDEGDLLAGRVSRLVSGHPGIHEGYRWAAAAAYPDVHPNPQIIEDSPAPHDFVAFYKGWAQRHVPVGAKVQAITPQEVRDAMAVQAFAASGVDFGHRLPRYPLILEKGAAGIRDEANAHLAALDHTQADSVRQDAFYRSIVIICDAMIGYGRRWADALSQLAAGQSDGARRGELEQMAQVCRRVPEHPARTFREAAQCVWFMVAINQAETIGSATSFGRLDQYLLPYYEADLAAGLLTREQALELIECLFLKCYRTFDFHHTMLGGLTPDGRDATNALSYLCLEATAALRTPRDICVRVHQGSPRAFLLEGLRVARIGLGRPDFFNDDVMIPALTRAGIPLEDARDYSAIGCVEVTIPGKCNSRTMCQAMNLAKVLEITLNRGKCALTGKQVGIANDTDFPTYESLHRAYRKQAERFIRMAIEQDVRGYVLQATEHPFPVLSALTVGCMESGRDVMDGGAVYNPSGVNLFGVANVADSLAAIKKLVYEDQALALDELRAALATNFEGNEPLRQMLLARVPKFGNDDPYVDQIAADEAAFYCDEVAKYPTPEGGKHHALIFGCTPASTFQVGPKTDACADGRLAKSPLATSVNPSHGRELSGVTAELNSVARIDGTKAPGGISFIVDLHPTAVEGDAGLDKFLSLLLTFFQRGGAEVGFNVFREEQLREAQQNPGENAHIMVRVFGFSTQFVSLDPDLQEYVIKKTKHAT